VTASAAAARRHGWLELLQQSGPFLTVPVADRVWSTGLPAVPSVVRALLRHGVADLLATAGRSRSLLNYGLWGGVPRASRAAMV